MTAIAGQRLRAMETKYKESDGEAAFAYQIAIHPHIPLPRREYSFAAHVGRRHRFDFAWIEHGLAVEIEGNGTGGHEGRHRSWGGFRADAEKYTLAARLGWYVLRFTTDQVEDMTAFDALNDWFAAHGHKAS